MTTAVEHQAAAGVGPDARETLRCVTVALAATTAIWRAANAGAIPLTAPATLVAALVLALAYGGWAWWLASRPSRACHIAGATAMTAILAASVVVLWRRAADGPAPGFAELVGLTLQLTLLTLTLVATAAAVPAVACRVVSRVGLVCVAFTLSVAVAGGSHAHAQSPSAGAPNPAPAGTTGLICHLI